MKRAGRTAVAVGIVVALVLAGLGSSEVTRVARAASIVGDAGTTVDVTATSTFSFTPNVFNNVTKDTTISVDFTNGDANGLTHTFTLLGCANKTIPRSGPDAYDIDLYINGSRCGAPLINIVPPTTSSKTLTFSSPAKAGWYEFICTEPGHFEAGMFGFVGIGIPVPANLTPTTSTPGAGLAVFIIVGTIVTLTVIAIVLGFVVGKREGAKHEMPPERLGYPEPGSPPVVRPPTPPSSP